MVPRDHRQSTRDLRRRQWVTLVVVVIGGAVLTFSINLEPGSSWFYPATIALALIWVVGAFASGPLHLGHQATHVGLKRPVLSPVLLGLALAGLFVVGGLVVRDIPWLGDQVRSVLDHAGEGSLAVLIGITLINGIAEEVFFRGAVYAALPLHPVAVSTVAYALVTLATGNVMLALAGLLLGIVVGLERRASGGVLAPILTHITWSITMLLVLPPIMG